MVRWHASVTVRTGHLISDPCSSELRHPRRPFVVRSSRVGSPPSSNSCGGNRPVDAKTPSKPDKHEQGLGTCCASTSRPNQRRSCVEGCSDRRVLRTHEIHWFVHELVRQNCFGFWRPLLCRLDSYPLARKSVMHRESALDSPLGEFMSDVEGLPGNLRDEARCTYWRWPRSSRRRVAPLGGSPSLPGGAS